LVWNHYYFFESVKFIKASNLSRRKEKQKGITKDTNTNKVKGTPSRMTGTKKRKTPQHQTPKDIIYCMKLGVLAVRFELVLR
jgi:hypothetical protein